MRPNFFNSHWLLAGLVCLVSGCASAPTMPPAQTSVFGPGGFVSTASPPLPYVNQGRNAPLQTLNSLPVGAATGVSGPF